MSSELVHMEPVVWAGSGPGGGVRPRARRRAASRAALALLAGGTLAALGATLAGGYGYRSLAEVRPPENGSAHGRKDVRKLETALATLAPAGTYIIIDTAENRLYLKRSGDVVREAVCSAGTGAVLEEPRTGRRWVFDTPRGARRIESKIRNPVWRGPDWAFIELGEPIPENAGERLDPVAMGDYAMGIGDGIFIHGTLYTRLLGKNVTHGCIRLADDDLEAVFNAVSVGTPVYIY